MEGDGVREGEWRKVGRRKEGREVKEYWGDLLRSL